MLEFLKMDLSNNIAVFIIIVMFFFSLFLIMKIKRLKEEIENLKFEDKSIFQNEISNIYEDVVSIGTISKYEDVDKEKNELNNSTVLKEEVSIVKKDEVVDDKLTNKKKLLKSVDTKNELDDSFKDMSDVFVNDEKINIEKASFNLDEFVRDNHEVKDKVCVSKINNDDYLSEISKKMAEELGPQTIELTDYEKDQEENAIISYQELLSVKGNTSDMDDDEVTIDFIEELKKLRNSLN